MHIASLTDPGIAVYGLVAATFAPDEDIPISRQLHRWGGWEPLLTSVICHLMRPGTVFVDVGANLGFHSLIACALGADVIAIEPNTDCVELMKASIDLNGFADRCSTIVAAAGAAPGSATLTVPERNAGDGRVDFLGGPTGRTIDVVTVDAALESAGLRADVIKVDVQGGEAAVAAGMARTIRDNPDLIVLLEWSPDSGSLRELVKSLRSDRIFHIDDRSHSVTPIAESDFTPDFVAGWPRGHFDLVFTRSERSAAVLMAADEYLDSFRCRYSDAFWGPTVRDGVRARWCDLPAAIWIDNLSGFPLALEADLAVLRDRGAGDVLARLVGVPANPASVTQIVLGPDPRRLDFVLPTTGCTLELSGSGEAGRIPRLRLASSISIAPQQSSVM